MCAKKKNNSDLNPCNVFICSFPGDALNTFIVHTDSVCAVGICIAPNTRDKSRSIEVIFYTISVCIHGAYTHNWFGSFFIVVRCTQIQFALHSLIFFCFCSLFFHHKFKDRFWLCLCQWRCKYLSTQDPSTQSMDENDIKWYFWMVKWDRVNRVLVMRFTFASQQFQVQAHSHFIGIRDDFPALFILFGLLNQFYMMTFMAP